MSNCNLYLAPMAGITDWPFRLLCLSHGCDFATTEMISAQGYLTAPKDRAAYRFLIARAPFEGPLIAQLFGTEPVYIMDAAKRLTDTGRFVGIDINMGCPAQKVTGGGAGSALMRDEEAARRVIHAAVSGTELPVSVKMRLGWDENSMNAVRIAHIAQEEGASLITVHGRTRMQQYSGKADWNKIAEVKQSVRIPVIANGDVTDGQTGLQILHVTGCDGIAIGRGARGNPWIFEEVKAAVRGEEYHKPSLSEIIRTAKAHAHQMSVWKGEKSALLEMRKYFAWYIHDIKGAAALRAKINVAPTFEQVFELLDAFEEAQHEQETI